MAFIWGFSEPLLPASKQVVPGQKAFEEKHAQKKQHQYVAHNLHLNSITNNPAQRQNMQSKSHKKHIVIINPHPLCYFGT